jgi:hypothetical protein
MNQSETWHESVWFPGGHTLVSKWAYTERPFSKHTLCVYAHAHVFGHLKVEAEGAQVLIPSRGLVDHFDEIMFTLLNLYICVYVSICVQAR